MYSATLNSFPQRDPAGYIDGMNLYAYVQNNPVRYLDPRGLQSLQDFSLKQEYTLGENFDFDIDIDSGSTSIYLAEAGNIQSDQFSGLYNRSNNYSDGWMELSRMISSTGGVPSGVDPVPIPWGKYTDDFTGWIRNNAVTVGNALFPSDDRPLGIRIQDTVQSQLNDSGLGQHPGSLVSYTPPRTYIAKGTAFVVGVGVGMATTPGGAVFAYWATDSVLGLLSGEAVSEPKYGIELVNPPNVHAPVNSPDY